MFKPIEVEWRIYMSVNYTISGSENGLSPDRRQAIIWTNAGILLIGPLENKLYWNLNRNLYIFIQENASENVVWNVSAILSRAPMF